MSSLGPIEFDYEYFNDGYGYINVDVNEKETPQFRRDGDFEQWLLLRDLILGKANETE
jgi:hypothetical protein